MTGYSYLPRHGIMEFMEFWFTPYGTFFLVVCKTMAYQRKPVGYRGKRRMIRKKVGYGMKRFEKGVRKVLYKSAETKQFFNSSNITPPAACIHRDFFYVTPLTGLTIGTGNTQRIGNKIFLKGIKIKFNLDRVSTFFDDFKVRFVAWWAAANEVDQAEVATSSLTNSATIRDQVFANESRNLETIERRNFGTRAIFDKTFLCRSNNYGAVTSAITRTAKPYSVWLSLNKPIYYRAVSGTSNPHRNLFVAWYFYGGGLVPSDVSALCTMSSSWTMYFKDV